MQKTVMNRVMFIKDNGQRTTVSLTKYQAQILEYVAEEEKITKRELIKRAVDSTNEGNNSERVRDYLFEYLAKKVNGFLGIDFYNEQMERLYNHIASVEDILWEATKVIKCLQVFEPEFQAIVSDDGEYMGSIPNVCSVADEFFEKHGEFIRMIMERKFMKPEERDKWIGLFGSMKGEAK